MKKILLTAILAGGTLFAANAGDFVLNLPGFFLKVGDGHTTISTCPPRHHGYAPVKHVIHHRPAPPRRYNPYKPIPVIYHRPEPPRRNHDPRGHRDGRRRR